MKPSLKILKVIIDIVSTQTHVYEKVNCQAAKELYVIQHTHADECQFESVIDVDFSKQILNGYLVDVYKKVNCQAERELHVMQPTRADEVEFESVLDVESTN